MRREQGTTIHRKCGHFVMCVRALLPLFSVPLMRLLFARLVMKRFICATSLPVDMYGLGLLIPRMSRAVTYVKMHLFPGDKLGRSEELGTQPLDPNQARRELSQPPKLTMRENQKNHRPSPVPVLNNNIGGDDKIENQMIDLNTRPQRVHGQASTNQEQGTDVLSGTNHESASLVPGGIFQKTA
nr:uncharacterized protein LOC111996602 isoform X2 [Quercus suber]